MDSFQICMTYEKSTKGTHVYKNEDSAIPSLYIRKAAFTGVLPKKIIITIKEKET